MGFESFRVELSGGPATHAETDEAVRRFPHARPDTGALASAGSTYYTLDGRHAIEVEVAARPVRVSLRFTLCHPPAVDDEFLSAVRELTAVLGMEARCPDDADAGAFPTERFAAFAGVVRRAIAARRAEWVAAFGPQQLAATTPEVFDKVILPRCAPAEASAR